ncbi:GNAT family N-acetyltransferase [Rickettsiaceae bacterium]|nr:GNAT family N-acetyltransferase [Rickettsiaceae bacterium]
MSKNTLLHNPTLIKKSHDKKTFNCGHEALNVFLQKYAIQNDKNNSSRTYVSLCKATQKVAGYYTLTYGAISHAGATSSVKKRMPNYPIPVMILARLAVSNEYQKLGVGSSLLKDALLRTMQASDIAGLRAIIAHAKDVTAKNFYLQYGFEESTLDTYHVMLPIQDIELNLRS